MILKIKTLFITGASRGIGLAIAKRAAADGANIVIAARRRSRTRKCYSGPQLAPREPMAVSLHHEH
jgi:NAD(P)-dependent dehydrogenase (short-subunit alcohol dehydrogenase family)